MNDKIKLPREVLKLGEDENGTQLYSLADFIEVLICKALDAKVEYTGKFIESSKYTVAESKNRTLRYYSVGSSDIYIERPECFKDTLCLAIDKGAGTVCVIKNEELSKFGSKNTIFAHIEEIDMFVCSNGYDNNYAIMSAGEVILKSSEISVIKDEEENVMYCGCKGTMIIIK